MFLLTCSTGLSSCGAQASLERKLPLDRVKRITAKAATPHLIWVFGIRFLNGGSVLPVSGFWFLVPGISDFKYFKSQIISDLKSQISNLRSQISDLKSQISDLRSHMIQISNLCISLFSNLRF